MIGLFFANGCSLKNSTITPAKITTERTKICQNEIEESVRTLIEAQHLTLSADVFSSDSYLYLTNQKGRLLKPSPIYNYPNGRKKLMLFKKDEALYIGLLDKADKIVKENKLLHCK
jgi:hypothetical protein